MQILFDLAFSQDVCISISRSIDPQKGQRNTNKNQIYTASELQIYCKEILLMNKIFVTIL